MDVLKKTMWWLFVRSQFVVVESFVFPNRQGIPGSKWITSSRKLITISPAKSAKEYASADNQFQEHVWKYYAEVREFEAESNLTHEENLKALEEEKKGLGWFHGNIHSVLHSKPIQKYVKDIPEEENKEGFWRRMMEVPKLELMGLPLGNREKRVLKKKDSYEDIIRKMKDENDKQKLMHAAAMLDLKNEHAAAMLDLKNEHAAAILDLKNENKQLKVMIHELKEENEKQKLTHAAAMLDLKNEHAAALLDLKNENKQLKVMIHELKDYIVQLLDHIKSITSLVPDNRKKDIPPLPEPPLSLFEDDDEN